MNILEKSKLLRNVKKKKKKYKLVQFRLLKSGVSFNLSSFVHACISQLHVKILIRKHMFRDYFLQ